MADKTEETGAGKKEEGGDTKTSSFNPVTFTSQADLDAAFADRAARAANVAKQEVIKPLQELGIGVDEAAAIVKAHKEAEEAKKDPAVREREAHEKTQRELQAYKDKEARQKLATEVAKDFKIGDVPIPAELLVGNTKEEMEAHAKLLVDFYTGVPSGPRPPRYNPLQGNNSGDTTQKRDPIRNYMSTGSF